MSLPSNITLIGMSGSGKSTLGKMLSEYLAYTFVDSDDLIEQGEKKLQEIIDTEGEDALLEKERAVLLSLGGEGNIFSPGGSCVFSWDAMEHLQKISLIVFIDVGFDALEKRFSYLDAGKRGIIGMKGRTFRQLYDLRHPLYLKYADVTICLDHHSIEQSFLILLDRIGQKK